MQKHSFDLDWRFKIGDSLAHNWRAMDFTEWQHIDLPHDWSVSLERSPANTSGANGGWFTTGMGWYRKAFSVSEEWQSKQVLIEFEGVYMNAEVWLNDHYLGRHPYGYTSFTFNLTPYLNLSEENVLYVSVDNTAQRNSRWYSGSGIYRHVWLWVADDIHIDHWGVYVTTPAVSPEQAIVHVKTSLRNVSGKSQDVILQTCILTPDGVEVGKQNMPLSLAAEQMTSTVHEMVIHAPVLWSPEMPNLYMVQSALLINNQVIDTAVTPLGIRSLLFDAEQGFLLNGIPTLLKGGCVHHDDGVLGAASYDRAEERKVELLKASGFNAIRCAHNPPASGFLDACDRLGILVIDEAFDCWREGKNTYDYHISFDDWWQRDLDSMLLRDRNHPSIIMWSIGNEVLERAGHSGGAGIASMLADYIRKVDPTRPVTAAVNGSGGRWAWELTDATFNELDVGGYNYQLQQYEGDHLRDPSRVMYGSESTAGEAFDHWMAVLDHSHVIGDFVWTSLDYLGESGIGRVHFEDTHRMFLGTYPWHQANCGDLDLCGFKRPQSYYRDILWQRGDKLSIFVHEPIPEGKTPHVTFWGWPEVVKSWTWPGSEGQNFTVDVYADCDTVELFLNDVSLGSQPATKSDRYVATFNVPYTPGKLRAVGMKNGQLVAGEEIITVGTASQIQLSSDRCILKAEPGDLSFVTVKVTDALGNIHPQADNRIYFTVKGVGSIAAVGSSNPISTDAYVGNQQSAYRGRCLVVVKNNGEPGEIRLCAMADGLEGAETIIQVR